MAKHRITYRTQNDLEGDMAAGAAAAFGDFDESLTQQQFIEEADINVLAKRWGLVGGQMPVAPINPADYGDFSNVPDLRTALDLVNEAKNRFMELPPALRYRFHNSPGELWDFVTDPNNAEEAVRLGLLARLQPETPAEPKGDA